MVQVHSYSLVLRGFNTLNIDEILFVESECAVTFIKTLKHCIIVSFILYQSLFNLVRNLGDIELF